MTTKPKRRRCDCGCKRYFTPSRPWQRFKDDDHRRRWWSKLNLGKLAEQLDRAQAHIVEGLSDLAEANRILHPLLRKNTDDTAKAAEVLAKAEIVPEG